MILKKYLLIAVFAIFNLFISQSFCSDSSALTDPYDMAEESDDPYNFPGAE